MTLLEHNGDTGGGHQLLHVWPDAAADVDVHHLPSDVEGYYRNAIKVLDAGVPDAAAVQLRKTLEAAAAHRGIDKGTLVERIRELIKQGLITTEFGAAIDQVRKVGNAGAHASDETVDEATARRALRFTTALLRNLFEIPAELALGTVATTAAAPAVE